MKNRHWLLQAIGVVAMIGSAEAAQSPQLLPFPRTMHLGGGLPRAGDFDQDGVIDFALAHGNPAAPGVTVRRGLGLGFLAPDEVTLLPDWVLALRAADFDHDGRDDLAGAAKSAKKVYLLSRFASPSFSAVTSQPYAATGQPDILVETGDFDGDGNVDVLVLPIQVGAMLQVFLGDGLGGLAAPVSTAPFGGSQYRTMTVADFDGDGLSDVAYQRSENAMRYQLSVGGGSFGTPLTVATSLKVDGVRSGDVDGDGVVDVLCTIYDSGPPVSGVGVMVAHGDGAGGFVLGGLMAAPSSTGPWKSGDLDGDGNVDMLAVTGEYFLGLGGGSFAPVQKLAATEKFSVADMVDANQDGLLDLIGGSGSLITLFATAPLTYPHPTYTHTTTGKSVGIAAADFDGDGALDLAVGDRENHRLVWLPGNGLGGFAAPIIVCGAHLPMTVACADFDGDGNTDIAAGSWSGWSVSVVFGDGAGDFALPQTVIGLGGAPHEVIAEDLNGDGLADIAAACVTGPGLSVVLSTGGGSFAPPQKLSVPFSARGLCSLDADSDGVLDLAVSCYGSTVVQLALGSASGTFALGNTIPAGSTPWRIASGDVDLDGDDDLVVAGDTVSVFEGDGTGAFSLLSIVPGGPYPRDVMVSDFDGDSFDDLVAVGFDGSAAWWRGNGRGQFSAVRWYGGINGINGEISFALGDFTGDGRTDIAVPNSAEPFVIVYPQLGIDDLPLVHCVARTTSNGCVPRIEWDGLPRASSASGFTIRARDVRNQKSGLIAYGFSGPAALPFLGGTLCVAPAIRRTVGAFSGGSPPPASDCSGVLSLDFAAFSHGSLGGIPLPPLLVPGTQVAAQWFGRDPGFPAPDNVMMSDGVLWTVFP